MSSHDSAPWRMASTYPGELALVRHDTDGATAPVHMHRLYALDVVADDAQAVANLRRIVACVNACEGIATQAIEADGTGGVRETLRQNAAALLRLNACLEAAVQVAQPIALKETGTGANNAPTKVYHPAIEACREALLEVKPLIDAITNTQGPEWAER